MTLVLNLDRRPARLRALGSQPGMRRIAWQREAAVDGASTSWEEMAPLLTRAALEDAQWAESEGVPTICGETGSFSPHLTRGAAACAATHRTAWERLEASEEHDVALILEDDARVAPNLADGVDAVLAALEQHPFWKVCYLGTHEGGAKLKAAGRRVMLRDPLELGEVRTGLAGYLVRRSDVRELIDGVFPLDEQLDVALSQHEFGHGGRFEVSHDAQLVVSPPSEEGETDVQTLDRSHGTLPPRLDARLLGKRRRRGLQTRVRVLTEELRRMRQTQADPQPCEVQELKRMRHVSGEPQALALTNGLGQMRQTSDDPQPRGMLEVGADTSSQSALKILTDVSTGNDALLSAEPRRRWCGGVRPFHLGATQVSQTLRFIEGAENHDQEGFLLVGTHRVGGFSNERRIHADRFDPCLQWRHSRHFPSVDAACEHIPGFEAIVDGVLRRLPETHVGGRHIVPMHANYLDQSSRQTRQREHDDLDEELREDGMRDRVIRYTGVVSLAGGVTSMRVAGQAEVFYDTLPGSGLLFRSALKHETVSAGRGVRKLTIFFGWMLV